MAANPLIALSAATPDIYGSFQRGRQNRLQELLTADQRQQQQEQSQRQNRLLDLQEQSAATSQRSTELQQQATGLQITGAQRKLMGQAAAETALSLDPMIQAGDFNGALQAMENAYGAMAQQGLRAPDPVALRDALRSGDAETAAALTAGIVNRARQLGYIAEPRSGADAPASWREWQEYDRLSDADKERYLQMKRADQLFRLNDVTMRTNPITGTAAPVTERPGRTQADVQAEINAQAGNRKASEAEGSAIGTDRGKRTVEAPQARMRVESLQRRIDNVISQIDELVGTRMEQPDGSFAETPGLVDWTTVGPAGRLMSSISGTAAFDTQRIVDTIKANIGFDKLQEMRDLSPTGGALGQVAVQELEGLQASIASLDSKMSPTQLRANLQRVREHYVAWRRAVEQQHQQRYGQESEDWQSEGADGAPQPGAVMDGYRFRGGDPGNPNSWEPLQ